MKPTTVQRQIMERLREGAMIAPHGKRLVLLDGISGVERLIPRATMAAMCRHDWLVSIQLPGQRPLWFLSHAGRAALLTRPRATAG